MRQKDVNDKMSIIEIQKQSGLKLEVAESLYWHSIWLREAKPDEKVQWSRMLRDKDYRLGREK